MAKRIVIGVGQNVVVLPAPTGPPPSNPAPQGIPAQRIEIVAFKPRIHIKAIMGEEPPVPTAGYGGWELLERRGAKQITTYAGVEPLQMNLPLIIDGWIDNQSVEDRVKDVQALGRNRKDQSIEPPEFRVFGAIPYSGRKWLAEEIEWGAGVRTKFGTLVRQPVVITLREPVRPDRLKIKRKRKRGNDGSNTTLNTGGGGRDSGIPGPLLARYTVRKGDTLYSIALRFYHDRGEWQTIARANNLRDPRNPKVGTVLKIPET